MPITVELKDQNGDRLVSVPVREGSIGYRRCGVSFNPTPGPEGSRHQVPGRGANGRDRR